MHSGDVANEKLVEITARIVAAYVHKNAVERSELPGLISGVLEALRRASAGEAKSAATAKPVPAVPIKESVTDDFIICPEDGKPFKSLRRHLKNRYDMSLEEYRAKWELPSDYPMVAPAYAAKRSDLAKAIGLGNWRPKRDDLEAMKSAPKRRMTKQSNGTV